MKLYAEYLRKSRADIEAESHGEGETLARHIKILEELKNKLAITVSPENSYKEMVSGDTIVSRPVVQQLLKDVESGKFEGVLVVEVERLARGDTIDQGQVAKSFKYSKTKIITPLKTYDPENEFDEEYFEFGLFMSRREFKTINRRLQRGREASVKEGKTICSVAPYGYKKVKIKNEKGYTLQINEEEANVIKKIYGWYTIEGVGMPTICRRLDLMGIKPRVNKTWSRYTIRDILANPVYIGKVRWGYKRETKRYENGVLKKSRVKSKEYAIYNGVHEPIIDDLLFEQAKKMLATHKKQAVAVHAVQNPLAGIVYCAKCGRLMNRLAPNSRNPYAALKCPDSYCDNVSAPLYLVENQILISLTEWLEKYKLSLNVAAAGNHNTMMLSSSLKQADEKMATLNKQLSRTYDLLEQGIYTADIFLSRSKTIQEQIEMLNDDIISLHEQLSQEQLYADANIRFIPTIESILANYRETADPADRSRLLKSVLEKVTYVKTEKNTRGKREHINFEIALFPVI